VSVSFDTICAISTPPGIGGIAVIRLSGPDSWRIVVELSGSIPHPPSPIPNSVHFSPLYDDGELLDEALLTFFRAPKSYTGDDVVEISCHGGGYAAKRVLHVLLRNGARLARAGEFTERAFLNGKLDLAQAEAVADLIHARSETSGKIALRQLEGRLSALVQDMRAKILDLLALLELELDFSEEDVEFQTRASRLATLNELQEQIRRLSSTFARGRFAREGLRVAIVGAPNAGKSTLLNRIVGDDRAIVSPEPGTTRDVIEAHIELAGIEVIFQDTAGLRETDHDIESQGIARTRRAIERADLVVLLIDAETNLMPDAETLSLLKSREVITVFNKCDLSPVAGSERGISAKTGESVEELLQQISSWSHSEDLAREEIVINETRHFEALTSAGESLVRAALQIAQPVLMVSDLRDAANALGEITGETIGEEILDRIFSKFCIGK
jgi:tRNA modification GTPase